MYRDQLFKGARELLPESEYDKMLRAINQRTEEVAGFVGLEINKSTDDLTISINNVNDEFSSKLSTLDKRMQE